jgi:hypothetical protein
MQPTHDLPVFAERTCFAYRQALVRETPRTRRSLDMRERPRDGMAWPLFLVAAAAGPAAALFHEFEVVPLGPSASLWPLLVIVLAAGFGLCLGLRLGRDEVRGQKWLAVFPNGLVLCLYGFFLLFFGLGGSR